MYTRDYIEKGGYTITEISTEDQLPDIITKGLGKTLFLKHRKNLNLG